MERIQEMVLNWAKGDIETCLIKNSLSLTRFSNSSISSNVCEEESYIRLRVIKDKRQAAISTNILTEKSLKEALDKVIELSEYSKEDPYLSLPKPQKVEPLPTFYKETENISLNEKAEIIKKIIERGKKRGCKASGSFQTSSSEISICNSLGIDVKTSQTAVSFVVIMEYDNSSGYASGISRDIKKINFLELGDYAIEKAISGKNPKDIEPGEYEVILEEPAVSEILLFLGYVSFNGLAFQEKRSFMVSKMGEKIAPPDVTIWDDGRSLDGMAVPFDFEGVPKQKVIFIENGIAKGLAYDTYTANRENKASTGHSLPQPNISGPFPTNLFMKEGYSTKDEMIKRTKKGLLISRFHYTNLIEPMSVLLTGMTRDGVFLIENGKVLYPIKNLRFTQSILDALSNISMISKERKLCSCGMIMEFFSSSYVPSIKIDKFNFTGKTEF